MTRVGDVSMTDISNKSQKVKAALDELKKSQSQPTQKMTALSAELRKLQESLEKGKTSLKEEEKTKIRHTVHFTFAGILFVIIVIFKLINNEAMINNVFTWAGYTYGPLLGLYSFGLFTKKQVHDKLVPVICILSPVACIFLNNYSKELFNGYRFGFEMLIVNGLFTFIGLLIISKKKNMCIYPNQSNE